MQLLQHLQAKYPVVNDYPRLWAYVLGAGVFAALFLIVFQPFGTREFIHPFKYWFLAGYGLIISLGLGIFLIGLPRIFDADWIEQRWTVAWQIIWLSGSFSIVIFACFCYKQWFFGETISFTAFLSFFPLAFSVAIFPISATVLGSYIRKLKAAQTTAGQVNARMVIKKPSKEETIIILDDQGRMHLQVDPRELLFLKSADNYVEIYFGKHSIEKSLVRNSLKKLGASLQMEDLVRCHRSYLINLDRVTQVTGNAQAYQAHFDVANYHAPIARNRAKEVFARLAEEG